jgi:hypothetical protein
MKAEHFSRVLLSHIPYIGPRKEEDHLFPDVVIPDGSII